MSRARGWWLLGGVWILAVCGAVGLHAAGTMGSQAAPRIDTALEDPLGRPVSVSCASCHANFPADPSRRSAVEPEMEFHRGLRFEHGTLACGSCHDPHTYDSLRLADGSEVGFDEATSVCGQCHAPQARDYRRAAHGGMTGYWDPDRGPQVRKRCIDCHDPHAPRIPSMQPIFKPIDRFRRPPKHDGHE